MSGSASLGLLITIHNEQVKLRANLLNAAAATCFTVGVAAPIAAGVFYSVGSVVPLRSLVAGVIFWSGAASVLHRFARHALEGLR
jgi:hypothetical protein